MKSTINLPDGSSVPAEVTKEGRLGVIRQPEEYGYLVVTLGTPPEVVARLDRKADAVKAMRALEAVDLDSPETVDRIIDNLRQE